MPNFYRGNRRQQSAGNQQPSSTTEFYASPEEALNEYTRFQPARVIASFRAKKYEVSRVGVRKTKNQGVVMFRCYVKVNPAHETRLQRSNAATLVRNIFPGIGDISFYRPEDNTMDEVCIVWFAFDTQPFEPKR